MFLFLQRLLAHSHDQESGKWQRESLLLYININEEKRRELASSLIIASCLETVAWMLT